MPQRSAAGSCFRGFTGRRQRFAAMGAVEFSRLPMAVCELRRAFHTDPCRVTISPQGKHVAPVALARSVLQFSLQSELHPGYFDGGGVARWRDAHHKLAVVFTRITHCQCRRGAERRAARQGEKSDAGKAAATDAREATATECVAHHLLQADIVRQAGPYSVDKASSAAGRWPKHWVADPGDNSGRPFERQDGSKPWPGCPTCRVGCSW